MPVLYIQSRYRTMPTQITKWGNSLGLRIPKAVAEQVNLGEGDIVDLTVERDAIVVRPARPKYSLDELVDRITPRNRHRESDWGGAVGNEVW